MYIFDLLNSDGVKRILEMINKIIDIIHIVVPIGLIIMTTLDIVRKIIDPNDKEGQKKILHRVIAALIVFMIPLFVNFVMKLVNIGLDNTDNSQSTNSQNTDNNGSQNNSSNNNGNQNDLVKGKIKITTCPSENKVYSPKDRIVLNADVPNNYSGNVIWEMYYANDIVNLNPSMDTLFVNIDVLKYYPGGKIIIIARGSQGKIEYDMCKIHIRNSEKVTGYFLINNCPDDKVKVGESFTISSNSDVKYYNYIYENFYELTDNQNGTATVKVIGHYDDSLPLSIQAQSKDGKISYCNFYTYKE